ncbi:glucosaminidase domain-containing protein [Paraglaciecola arctica]|uniref:glucosaminidase domain-containing protein n=1 Tax=Paraglaciecola arctica TaxID=1128911 RepID=UPI001C069512|nr:glucosaminidase domain-containing protein [Paraglaciecola arctica]MBU3002742.1 glucosaminidase domain-containing protein [Paraglaciecola arctica]
MPNFIRCFVVSFIVVVSTLVLIVFVQQFSTKTYDNISLESLYVAPLESSNKAVPDFSTYSNVTAKKRAFFAYLKPEIQRQNQIVLKERDMVFALQEVYAQQQYLTKRQQKVFDVLAEKYRFTGDESLTIEQTFESLIRRVDTIPEALVLVQAANESGWGTSRFAQKGYNFFGLWCFKEGCGFVPKLRENEAVHEVAKFRSLSHAVMTYIRNLNRHYAYKELRSIRQNLRTQDKPVTASALALGLSSYSERGQEYIEELLSMLRVNKKHMDTAS